MTSVKFETNTVTLKNHRRASQVTDESPITDHMGDSWSLGAHVLWKQQQNTVLLCILERQVIIYRHSRHQTIPLQCQTQNRNNAYRPRQQGRRHTDETSNRNTATFTTGKGVFSNFSIFFKLNMVTFIYFRYFVIFSTFHDILLIYI